MLPHPLRRVSLYPLLKSAALEGRGEGFQGVTVGTGMAFLTAGPLAEEEENMLEDGAALFDAENSGTLTNRGKSCGTCSNAEVRRPKKFFWSGTDSDRCHVVASPTKNRAGVEKQWGKLEPKLRSWEHAWGLDVSTHLAVIETYAADAGTWTLVANNINFREREVQEVGFDV